MSLRIIVLAKQVPDTRNVGKDAMKADGTINRAALPAIFNPEDLNALEQALRLKDAYPGTTVTLLTMGPGRAAEIIREGLYRGADGGFLLTDRAFAGADTLATSYALATAIKKINDYDIIIGGRQAIDGDTAQVGPQVAEKLGLTQITYAEEILNVDKEAGRITVKRHIDGGVETVEGPLPIVITVNGSAAPCRPRNAKLVQKYKYAMGKQERNTQPACIGSIIWFMRSKMLDKLALKKDIDSKVDRSAEKSVKVGDTGISTTRLAQIGYAEINGNIVEVRSIDGFLNEKTPIIVSRITDGTILVEKHKI